MTIRTNDAVTFGNSGRVGLHIPGAAVFGLSESKPDTSPIYLNAEKLDPRISYLCESSHAYIGADGLIHYAAPNTWPLEYRNGAPVGRHEPEPMRTNIWLSAIAGNIKSAFGVNLITLSESAPTLFADHPDVVMMETAPTGTHNAIMITPVTYPDGQRYVYSQFVKRRDEDRDSGLLMVRSVAIETPTTSSYYRFNNKTGAVLTRPTAADVEYGSVVYGDWVRARGSSVTLSSGTTTGGQYIGVGRGTVTNYAGDPSKGMYISLAQLEFIGGSDSAVATSPIIPGVGAVTRAAGFVPVPRQGAYGLRVIYDVGEPDIHTFPDDGGDVFYLPYAKYDWGYRLITEIQYITADIRPIDLTAAMMDERISFGRASAKTYWAADGTMQTAPADVWPVEHDPVTGEALGRWCEPMRTNYYRNNGNARTYGNDRSGTSTITLASYLDFGVLSTVRGRAVTTTASTSVYATIGSPSITGIPAGAVTWSVLVRAENAETTEITWYVITNGMLMQVPISQDFAYLERQTSNTTSYNGQFRVGNRNVIRDALFRVGAFQVENGDFRTSMILTGDTPVTRAADFPEIPTQGMQKLIITFHDGTTETVDVLGADSYLLPPAQKIYRTVNYG